MQGANSNTPIDFDGEVDLRELFNVLLQGKWIIVSVTAFVFIITVIYSLFLPNIYESKALLVPHNSSSGISGALKSYSGLAGLAGINLSSNGAEDNSLQAIEKISSLSFFENNILTNIYLPDLMAVKAWDPKTNILTYDKNVYDVKSSTWVRDYSYPQQQIPSAQETFKVFIDKHLNVKRDNKSGFISISIKHQSPHVSKQLVELIVVEINNFFRERDKLESQKAISYLNHQISMTSFSEIKDALAQLVKDQTKKLTLVEANEFYVLGYIDAPALMEIKSEPNRAIICILGALIGGLLSIFLLLLRHFVFIEKAR